MDCLIKFAIRLNILQAKKVVLQILLIIILEKPELIYTILYLSKKYFTLDNVIILVKSVVNKNKNNHYHNIFLEKGSSKDKSDTQYF